MPGEITREEVEHIASLARLILTEEDKDLYEKQLARILWYAHQLADVPTAGVPPTASVGTSAAVERDDEPRQSLASDAALRNAPDRAPGAGLFGAPGVFGE